MQNLYYLENSVMKYDWGSYTDIPDLLGWPAPSSEPVAELWMGAHPKAPSRLDCEGQKISLSEFVALHPEQILGKAAAARFGSALPFLFKVLAAKKPLSVQAHPDASMAKTGFKRENERHLSLADNKRNYRDDRAKPECICALTPFRALCGFRKIREIATLFERVLPPKFSYLLYKLKNENGEDEFEATEALKHFFGSFLSIDDSDKESLVEFAVESARKNSQEDAAFALMENIHREFNAKRKDDTRAEKKIFVPDTGVFAPLFLNPIQLEPGQALFMGAGVLHSYLGGLGIELMGNSDNVVRCALTGKHVDPDELSRVVRFETGMPDVLEPKGNDNGERVYETPAEEFVLSSIGLNEGKTYNSRENRSVEIILCTDGAARISFENENAANEIRKGDSILIPASAPKYRIEGDVELFKSSVPIG